ncbi:MAG: T9SS type A sorting domain-containing protein [Chlorobi bacterium]|nr:T9SS type A sorting domain-containing protein [Chlorobiota bacterium]
MRRLIISIIMILPTILWAQSWSVNSSDYQFSMSVTGVVDSNQVAELKDCWLGAFVGDECRGVVEATETSDGSYMFFLTVYSDSVSGEDIYFRFEDDSQQQYDLSEKITFLSDVIYGSPDNPFVWHFENIYRPTDFIFFSCENQVGATNINYERYAITINMAAEIDLTSLVSNFVTAEGATVYCDDVEQQSGVTVNDFSIPVVYDVVNGNDSSEWTVRVNSLDGIEEHLYAGIKVYPNPTSGIVNVDLSDIFSDRLPVVITDINGKCILKTTTENIDISDVPDGVYFMSIITQDGMFVSKILKRK